MNAAHASRRRNFTRALLIGALLAVATGAATMAHTASTQYMAICTERAEHGGSELGLSAWMATLDQANYYGKGHELFTRGHRWRIATRDAQ
jgi:hypothetical protein